MAREPREILREKIEKEVAIKREQVRIFPESRWLMDFRRVCLDPVFLDAYTEEFYERFKDELPFQVGGMEVAAIPLVAAIIMKMREKGRPINGFFIRKSRKKSGLLKMVEGKMTDEPIILVDDLINRAQTFERQLAVTDEAKKLVRAVFTVLRFRDLDYYVRLTERGIRVESVFALDDFTESIGVKNRLPDEEKPLPIVFKVKWRFQSDRPKLEWVQPKSGIAEDNEKIYFGTDRGQLLALRKEDGALVWEHRVGLWPRGIEIFSTPVSAKGRIYFGSRDGNVYCLDARTGQRIWVSFEVDIVEGKLLALEKQGILIVPASFGLSKRHGGVVALDLKTGKKVWEKSFPDTVTGAPFFSQKYNAILVGSRGGIIYALEYKHGRILWQFSVSGALPEGGALSQDEETLVMSSMDGNVYALSTKDGNLQWKFNIGLANYASPYIWEAKVFVASLDKSLYCFDLKTGEKKWSFPTRARIFASPVVINQRVYIGSNDARLYELDPETGKETGYFQVTERITNPLSYNEESNNYYLVTYANELYCLEYAS